MSIEGTKAIGIDELVKIEDGKKGAMFSRELVSQLSEEQRIAFVGEVTRARYKHKDAITEVYRNAAHIANPLVMQIVRDNNYPVTKDGIEDFFKLAKEAHNGNVDFKRKIQEKLNNVPEKVIKVLLPFYYEYINDVSKESKEDAIEAMEKVRLEFGNVFNKLNVAIGLKGQVITKEDVSKQLKSVVDTTINGKSLVTIAIEQGNKAGVEKIIAAGADLDKVSNKYTRSPLQALKDGFKDFPENLKALFNKPPRSVVEIANISGNQEIVQAVQQAVEIRKETNEKAQKQQATVTSIISTTYSGPVPSDNPLFIKPLPIITPLMLQQKEEREKQRREVDKASSNPIKLSQPEKRGPTTSQRG